MTEQDLLSWALGHYFSQWEIDRAKVILERQSMAAAVEYLRKKAVESWCGFCGPRGIRAMIRDGKVELRHNHIGSEPDYVIDIAKFCQLKLESLYQIKLL